MAVNIREVVVETSNGSTQRLGDYHGKVLLIVNVASQCGFTKQYTGLQTLQERYRPLGFEVLGFPCNDFGSQEPGTLKEIEEFCSSTFGVTFTLFQKIHAKGATTEPFTTLNQTNPSGDVAWNFEKFLIDKNSNVLARFKSDIEPSSQEIKQAIEQALNS